MSGRFIARIVASDLEVTPPWLATQYIDGPSLYDVVAKQGGALSPSRAQQIAASPAEALDTIHAAGVVHRDVKPANILLAPDGAHLIDFGIAREAAANTITRTGTVVGTPPFMAPEQIRGHRTPGPPADIFALGGVLAYASTGRHPAPRAPTRRPPRRDPLGRPADDDQHHDRLGGHQHPRVGTRSRARHHGRHLTAGAKPNDSYFSGPETTLFPAVDQ
ncbi:serine/threonine protein kinase [Catenulispora sp. GAS73]